MDVKAKIKSLMKQGDLYRTQGLLTESKEMFTQAGKLVQKHEKEIKNKAVLKTIKQKIASINKEIETFDVSSHSIPVPKEVQDIIISKFSFSTDKDQASLEGAVALAKFGQFERALTEFRELVKIDSIRVDAAKNVFRCHMALNSTDDAINQYKDWLADESFSAEQMEKLRVFLTDILGKKGIEAELPSPRPDDEKKTEGAGEAEEEEDAQEVSDDEILDISSIGLKIPSGPNAGTTIEYDVSFQSGSIISLIISGEDKEMLTSLEPGVKLDDVQFFSPIAMFNGKAVVSSKSQIESGPKKGHFSVDIKIKSI
jgi:tetratricopeptide (TPR) repeat protein